MLQRIKPRHTRPDGSFIDYAWNARNLLDSVTSDAPPPLATYFYNGRNQIASTIVENGLFTASRAYDGAGRLTGITNGALDTTGYALSADGRRTGITRNEWGQSTRINKAKNFHPMNPPATACQASRNLSLIPRPARGAGW